MPKHLNSDEAIQVRDLPKEPYGDFGWKGQLLLIAIFCAANIVAAFKFRIAIEHAWRTDTVPDGAEIINLATGESKHGRVEFSKETVKICAANIARHLLTTADNTKISSEIAPTCSPENISIKRLEKDDKTMDISSPMCDDDVAGNPAAKGA